MATQKLVSGSITEETLAEILQMLAEIEKKMDFLITIGTKDIKKLVKANNKYEPLIDRAYQVAMQHPEILPPLFDVEGFKRIYELIKALTVIDIHVKQMADGTKNTLIAARSDAMVGTLDIYAAVQLNQERVPGLNVAAEEMVVFFPRTGKKKRAPVE